jgi:hypothetical protein
MKSSYDGADLQPLRYAVGFPNYRMNERHCAVAECDGRSHARRRQQRRQRKWIGHSPSRNAPKLKSRHCMYCVYIVILLYIIAYYCSHFLTLLPKIFITGHFAFVVGPKIFITGHFVHLTALLSGYNGEDTIHYNNNNIQ